MKPGKESRQLQNGNKVTLKIPGFVSNLNIQFPPRRLPVCEKCKRHYKTRNLCRVKKMHTDLPWCKTYLCITMDDTCTDDEGKITPGPYVAKTVSWRPYQFKPTVPMNCEYPMCADCKRKNYTGSYCRGRQHAHRYLPWDTVYVELSSATPSLTSLTGAQGNEEGQDENFADKKKNIKSESEEVKREEDESKTDADNSKPDSEAQESVKNEDVDVVGDNCDDNDSTGEQRPKKKLKSVKSEDEEEESHEFKNIDKSRTFFLEVSATIMKIQWLDLDEDRAAALAEQAHNNPLQNEREEGSQPYGDPNFQDPYRHPDYAQADQSAYFQYGPPPYAIHQAWNPAYYHQFPHQSPQAYNHGPPPIYAAAPPGYPQGSVPISQPEAFNQYYPPYFPASGYYPMQGTPQRENFTQESPNQGSFAKPPRAGYPNQSMPSQRESENQEASASHANASIAVNENGRGQPQQE